MKNLVQYFFIIVLTFSADCFGQSRDSFAPRKIDFDWQFHLGDIENGQSRELNTSGWRTLDLPHDWSIEGEYSLNNGTDWQSGFLPAGIGWYRKLLLWDPSWEGKRIKIYFEGIYLNSDVWINGHYLGHRPNGYIGFEYDVTDYLNKGDNVLAVRVDHSKPLTGRWYTGSGIYRHVWLKIKNPLYIAQWGVHFTTPEVNQEQSKYQVEVILENLGNEEKPVTANVTLLDRSGRKVSEAAAIVTPEANKNISVFLSGTLPQPERWSPDHPYLYTLKTSLLQDGKIMDEEIERVGFRKLEFSPDSGCKINNEITRLKGVCDHHTAGAFGSAVPDDIILFRLQLLKNMGCNAIRTSHNPFSPTFYDMCDSLGILVMNEFLDGWDTEKAPHDYGLHFENWWKTDATDFIKRDRNHPSVIIWSIGNEVRKPTREIQKQLVDLFHHYDSTRPVTQGGLDPTRGMTGDELPTLLDIKGFNGDGEEKGVLEAFHAKEPGVPMVCTEVPHTYQTRGVYRTTTQWRRRDFPAKWEVSQWDGTMRGLEKRIFPIPDLAEKEVFPEEKCEMWYQNGKSFPLEVTRKYQPYLYYQSSYDNASVRSSAREAWLHIRDLDYVMGHFRWGSFDYLGESNDWPSRFANFGVIDICGFPKDHYYLYQSMWTDKPMVHILPHWTHNGKEGVKIPVVAYTNCDEAELFLNGRSLGIQKYKDHQLVWMVPFEAGQLEAVARKDGKIVAEDEQTTAGAPAKIKLSANKGKISGNRTDVICVTTDITDKEGVICPDASNLTLFDVTGPARIVGIDNGDPLDLSSYKTHQRKAFKGKIMVWVQSTGGRGKITIMAHSANLLDDKIEIEVTD